MNKIVWFGLGTLVGLYLPVLLQKYKYTNDKYKNCLFSISRILYLGDKKHLEFGVYQGKQYIRICYEDDKIKNITRPLMDFLKKQDELVYTFEDNYRIYFTKNKENNVTMKLYDPSGLRIVSKLFESSYIKKNLKKISLESKEFDNIYDFI